MLNLRRLAARQLSVEIDVVKCSRRYASQKPLFTAEATSTGAVFPLVAAQAVAETASKPICNLHSLVMLQSLA